MFVQFQQAVMCQHVLNDLYLKSIHTFNLLGGRTIENEAGLSLGVY